jgi:hypothetical protein
MQIIIEDKENRRDIVNRQSANGGIPTVPAASNTLQRESSSSTTSLLKRSKTSDPNRAPLR